MSATRSVPATVLAAAAYIASRDQILEGVWPDEGERLDELEDNPFHAAESRQNGARPHRTESSRAVDGASFIRSVPETVPAIWGRDGAILWPEGEGLMIVGPDGVGKTSLGQQLLLARIGIRRSLLGLPIAPIVGRVLYIAADRPRQAASSLRRMVTVDDDAALRDRLVVWKGPLPFDLTEKQKNFADWLDTFGDISDVFIDSLKDVAVDLVKDEIGSRVNVAFQETIARGYQLAVNHHQRKEQQGAGKPRRLADVYGSRWLTAGMGSVCLLWGEPGDLVVEFRHLKQPVEEIGPFSVVHDHEHGTSTIASGADLEQALTHSTTGMTVADAAALMFETADPSRNEIEKARRRLNALISGDHAVREDDPDGTARYFARARTA